MGLIGRLPIRQPTGKGIQVLDRKRSDRILLYRPPGPRYVPPLLVKNEKSEVNALIKSMLVREEETK
jgi:hypothetical protein